MCQVLSCRWRSLRRSLRSVKRPSLSGKLSPLDLKVPDAVQDQLEDVAHRGVVDGTGVLLYDPPQYLLLAPGVVDGCPRRGLERHDLLHDARPLVQGSDKLSVDLVDPLPELPYLLLQLRIFHRTCDSIYTKHIRQPPAPIRNFVCCKVARRRLVFWGRSQDHRSKSS